MSVLPVLLLLLSLLSARDRVASGMRASAAPCAVRWQMTDSGGLTIGGWT
eukprot:SAG31_NODE_7095_length_1789_cov_22.649704_1_plen_49_part_10